MLKYFSLLQIFVTVNKYLSSGGKCRSVSTDKTDCTAWMFWNISAVQWFIVFVQKEMLNCYFRSRKKCFVITVGTFRHKCSMFTQDMVVETSGRQFEHVLC